MSPAERERRLAGELEPRSGRGAELPTRVQPVNDRQEAEHALWTAHRALINHQSAAARRRQLAAEVGELGELGGVLIGALAGAGGSQNDARGASVRAVTFAEGRGGSVS